MSIKQNTSNLQSILETVNNLPEAGGLAEPSLQTKTVIPSSSEQVVAPDNGYSYNGITCTGGADVLGHIAPAGSEVFSAPTVSGAIGVITIYDND